MEARGRHQVRRTLARGLAHLRWQPDQVHRLSRVASLVPDDAATVLDVGGRGRQMQFLLPDARVVSVNVRPPADVVIGPGDALPFADASFDVVVTTDVLEHVPRDDRSAHLAEVLRVARDRVVLCWPLGSPEKDAAEGRLAQRLRDELGVTLDFLEEHIALGLPREPEVRVAIASAAPDARIFSVYQEGIAVGDEMLLDALRAKEHKDPRALLRFLRASYFEPRRFSRSRTADSSRIFMVVDR